jgi:transposase
MTCNQASHHPAATHGEHAVILASLELARSKWLVTALLPGSEKMSKHVLPGGDGAALLALIGRLRERAARRAGSLPGVVVIQEAGLDGFWVHRLLQACGIESHVVDAASVAVPRRKRRAKSDAIDGETLLRTLLAWRRREPRVCSMVRPPSCAQEDHRRLVRERDVLAGERIRETNRIQGLLAAQGIAGYNPLRGDRRARLAQLVTGDGRPLPPRLAAAIGRALDRIELLLRQLAELERERDAALQAAGAGEPAALPVRLKGIGPQGAVKLDRECFFRHFDNRRQVAAYGGLAPSPWQSGQVEHDQGIAKAGNPRLRALMLELGWLWLRHQPGSALSRWWQARVGGQHGRIRRIAIVALARKLLIALWRYVTQGILPEGAELKAA